MMGGGCPPLDCLRRRLAARCTAREHILVLAAWCPRLSSLYFPHMAHNADSPDAPKLALSVVERT